MAGLESDERSQVVAELREIRRRVGEIEQAERELEAAYGALSASEARFRALVENSYDLVSELDAKGYVTWVSAASEEAIGWSRAELVGRFALERVHPDDLDATTDALATVVERGRARQHAYRYQHKDGGWVWLETSAASYRDEQGELRILAVSRNVTEQRRHLQQREAALRQKEEALEHVRVLSGLLPICTHCRKVRDDEGYWRSLEMHVADHSNAVFSHSLCEACLREHYGDIVGADD